MTRMPEPNLQPGDQVLVLSLLHGQPLQACYCGLYTVEQKVSKVNYAIKSPDRRKVKRLCHVKMLATIAENRTVCQLGDYELCG